MAQTTFTIRIDEDVKRDFNALCENIGLTMTTAFCVFAKKAVSEQRIPFEGIGKPEPLKHRSDYWSRRIDGKNRVIYKADGDSLIIAAVRGHY